MARASGRTGMPMCCWVRKAAVALWLRAWHVMACMQLCSLPGCPGSKQHSGGSPGGACVAPPLSSLSRDAHQAAQHAGQVRTPAQGAGQRTPAR